MSFFISSHFQWVAILSPRNIQNASPQLSPSLTRKRCIFKLCTACPCKKAACLCNILLHTHQTFWNKMSPQTVSCINIWSVPLLLTNFICSEATYINVNTNCHRPFIGSLRFSIICRPSIHGFRRAVHFSLALPLSSDVRRAVYFSISKFHAPPVKRYTAITTVCHHSWRNGIWLLVCRRKKNARGRCNWCQNRNRLLRFNVRHFFCSSQATSRMISNKCNRV